MKETGAEDEAIFRAVIHKERERLMSKVKNEPNIKNPLIAAIREQLEHRALWMYLLCECRGRYFIPAAKRKTLYCDMNGQLTRGK